jgi:hypothetical protein
LASRSSTIGPPTPQDDNPKDASKKGDPNPETADASKRYMEWIEKTRPTGATDRQWQVFKRIMEWEGYTSSVMTFDAANVTWGAGFAGLGARADKFKAGPKMLDILFKSSPQVRAIFWEAGFSFIDQELVVVDEQRGFKLRGLDAELYVRGNKTLLSLMINVAQGEFLQGGKTPKNKKGEAQPNDAIRQAVLDGQFQTFLAFTYRETDTGSPDVVALKAHARHSGGSRWGRASTFTALSDLVTFLFETDPGLASFVVPSYWRSLNRSRTKSSP